MNRPPRSKSDAPLESLANWEDNLFLSAAERELQPIVGDEAAARVVARARDLLDRAVDPEGIKAMVFQIIRNRDPEMKVNHITELNLADTFSRVPGRVLEVERRANPRNERKVDFGLDDPDHTWLVEVKNLNAPLIKKAQDPLTQALRDAVKGTAPGSDVHLTYLFFRRPREQDVPELRRLLVDAWQDYEGYLEAGRLQHVAHGEPLAHFLPANRPRVAALFVPARPDTGGRVIVYDHGHHLTTHPGARIRAAQQTARRGPSPRERVEELFVKDNIARRLQDAEGKFPVENVSAMTRVVAFYLGDWAPYPRLERYVREVAHWYVHGSPAPEDFWGGYYFHWAWRWRFQPQHNVDAVVALRGSGYERPYEAVAVYSRVDNLLERLFGA
ncbi:MAG: hypothetical protein FJX76_06800 [Armatimonadetes bacterium]|nr:hypothetical protein [Armatimonadota bacterium]